ncbi:glycine betaine/proline transport system permease protein [Salsuginibacillus halophilus]|uniref:Glycine betaine/proline transport system permease protein n=1 Tax=Salsuginibacillus halophilus TaxID=517424 RepID=A0A2P8HYQ6_9BACI|nr:proline/glycine betaine ABC transporter permease [Salsuginibacillus halophilus]PSL51350.1 glycine betaine/proline transport system permease protein [Salsuginibacillus halophilus]
MDLFPSMPLAQWIDDFVDWLNNAEFIFDGIEAFISFLLLILTESLGVIPEWIFIIALTVVTFIFGGRKTGLALFVLIGLFFIDNLNYWDDMILTLSLVLSATMISVLIGVPIGIWMSKNNILEQIIKPILDFMQTMPAFVYLIPAVAFFGIGMEPGVVASVIFAMPPTIRLTNLGIRQVSSEVIEASDAFGSTAGQKLWKVQLPMARTTIMAGINQTIMLALSMVVIASMIGASGLGEQVYYAVGRNQAGQGFEAGIAIVILAIILDRITQSIGSSSR